MRRTGYIFKATKGQGTYMVFHCSKEKAQKGQWFTLWYDMREDAEYIQEATASFTNIGDGQLYLFDIDGTEIKQIFTLNEEDREVEPQFFGEFPSIPVPQRALDLGMTDQAWHNDASARMTHTSQAHVDDEDLLINLWVGDDSTKEDLGYKYQVDRSIGWNGEEETFCYTGDDLNAALDVLEKALKEAKFI